MGNGESSNEQSRLTLDHASRNLRRMQAALDDADAVIDAAFAVGEGETVLVLLVAPSYAAGRDFS